MRVLCGCDVCVCVIMCAIVSVCGCDVVVVFV